MNVKSLQEGVKKNIDTGLYNLFTPTFINNPTIRLNQYEVTKDDEMRIDLVFGKMYLIDNSDLLSYLEDIDVILYINNIYNRSLLYFVCQ